MNHNSISFCINCMGRLDFLEQTLPYNIELCKRILTYSAPFEFVLLNYNSPDDLEHWVYTACEEYLNDGLLHYFKTTAPQHYQFAHAKNAAHRQAHNTLLVNLDADHFLSVFYLYALLKLNPEGLMYCPYDPYFISGTGGRVAIGRENFLRLGGYDESLCHNWGAEDDDFIQRALASRIKARHISSPLIGTAIEHGDEVRLMYLKEKNKDYKETKAKTEKHIAEGLLVANLGKDWGAL